MTDRRKLGNEESDKRPPERDDEGPSGYYYDDSTGYRIYDGDQEDDDDKADELDEDASCGSLAGAVREGAGLLKRFV